MITRFHILFKIKVSHTYYLDRECPDLAVVPSSSSFRKLQEFKLRHREKDNGILVAFEAADEVRTPVVPIEGNEHFTFFLKIENAAFLNFTDLPPKAADQIFYYDNLSGNALTAQPVKLKSSLFTYHYESATKNINLTLTNALGVKYYDEALFSDSKIFDPKIDARKWQPGIYEVKVKSGSTVVFTEKIYVSEEAANSRCFGIVELSQDHAHSFDYDSEQEFTIAFLAKAIPWKYIVELTKDYSSHTFQIEDKEEYSAPPDDPNYPYTSEIKFVEVGPITHQKGERAEFLTGTSASSLVDVPYSEVPKKKLRLTVSNGSGQLVVQNLPNPAVNNFKAEVYLKI